jgi:hypothetical protein
MNRRFRLLFSARWSKFPFRTTWIAGVCAAALACAAMSVVEAGRTGQSSSAAPKPPDQYLNTRSGAEYMGDETCRKCHSSIYTQFKQTGMGRSVALPSLTDLAALAKSIKLVNKESNRTYSVYARDGKMFHEESETDASGHIIFSESNEIAYTVGAGDVGKSYLVASGDALFVSPISYYTRIAGWDLSPGYKQGTFQGFTRRVVDLCVDCHTGLPQFVAGSHNRFQQPPFRFLTVGCERCHGPGAPHVRQHTEEASVGEPGVLGPIDFSIVNPRKLRAEIRDDVCAQCHLAGDARVLQPGKNYLDFRPGTPLGDVVAIFSVPQTIKGNHFVALDQFEQMKMSRCWAGSSGRLGCISCHDPHVQLHGEQAVDFFRGRCLTCHTTNSCRAPQVQRQATAPADNCIQCHMPKQPTENIGHSSVTDHRILRTQSEIPATLQGGPSAGVTDLISDTMPSESSVAKANLRNRALAYAQVAGHYPELGEKGLATLAQAATELPSDAEVQAAYGLVLGIARPREEQRTAQALQKAVDLGSQSVEVRAHLAALRMREGQVTVAMELYKESIKIEPYFTPAYLDLARIEVLLKDQKSALELLDRVLKMDPGNDAVREERRKVAALREDDK